MTIHAFHKRSRLLLFGCSLAASLTLTIQFVAGQTNNRNARSQQIHFEHIALPQVGIANGVTSIVQDLDRFLWVGTWGGLYRYDGYDFTIYRHNPLDSASISDDQVESLLVDRTGTLWVGIRQKSGLNRFNPATGTFTRYLHDPDNPHSLNDGQVSVLYEDHEGTLWVGSQGGLSRFNPDTETFTRFMHDAADPASLSNNWVHALFEDSRGTFWVGTSGYGLHTMDREQGTFTRHPYDPNDPGKLSGPYLADPSIDIISFIYEDRNGMLWIGAEVGGLNHYDPATGALARFQNDPSNPAGPAFNSVWTIYESQDGVLWMGTLGSGLYKLDPNPSDLKAIVQDVKVNAAKIEEHGRRADGIVQAMMQHARGGSGERAPYHVNALVEEYIAIAYHGKRAQHPDFEVEIEQDLSNGVGRVSMVAPEIARVLLNLLGNAFDAVYTHA